MADDGVLQLELGHAPPSREDSDEPNEHQVGEGSQDARMLPASVNQTGTESWTRQNLEDNLATIARWLKPGMSSSDGKANSEAQQPSRHLMVYGDGAGRRETRRALHSPAQSRTAMAKAPSPRASSLMVPSPKTRVPSAARMARTRASTTNNLRARPMLDLAILLIASRVQSSCLMWPHQA